MGAKSGIQKEVLALYRTLLREATKKDRMAASSVSSTTNTTTATNTDHNDSSLSFRRLLFAEGHKNDNSNNDPSSSTVHARKEFRRQASQISRKDFRAIEYKIRHGYKQIKLLQMPGVVNFKSW